ncbi:MAG: inositol monophosphatase [Coriobacteriia bacterium]|nr:inositol monophosphatase [Coriobacteriia bacterium]
MLRELDIARVAALAGGRRVAARLGDLGRVRTKGSPTDYVTDVDIDAGVAVLRAIAEETKGARFVVEEREVYDLADASEGSLGDSEVWVVDPLDGTTSFMHGFPCYSVSVALLRDGEPVVGAVYNVPSDELASGAVGQGAWLGDRTVRCSDTHDLREALLVTGFPYDRTRTLDRQLDVLARFLRTPVQGIRRDGSAANDCVHVAAGRADGFWEFGLQPWDTAAGAIICREAGAHISGIDGEPWSATSYGVIAANPVLHARMLELIQSSDMGDSDR